jgi:hypothetical protein
VAAGEGELLRFDLGDDYQEAVSFHRWFAMRGISAARAAVAFTTAPEWLRDPEKLALVTAGDDAALAATVARRAGNTGSDSGNKAESVLDLCAGVGTIGAMAARLGFEARSVELSVVPHLIGRVLYDFPVSIAAADERRIAGCWRGYVAEVADFADAVWRGAKDRLQGLFEPDVDIRIWVRVTDCPFCGNPVPVVSNARLSGEAALSIIPEPSPAGGSRFPRFGLLRTEFPDLPGTFAKGSCTCPSCRNRFRFQGHDLVSLGSVPVAVRMRDAARLSEIDAPDAYVQQVEKASYDSLAASSRRLGEQAILSGRQAVFHDIRGAPIMARDAFLPRQRAYFAALAESMSAESARLAQRTALAEEQRTAVRTAVALLISSQADFVNTCVHSSIDKPHPSTLPGPLRPGGLFIEVGGSWLERFWRNRRRHLLDLLRQNSSAARPVQAIKANANAIPLGDASVSAVIWDPPYYDNIDYDTVSSHYQSVLTEVVPDIADGPVFRPRLPRAEHIRRYEDDLVQQAREARRVVRPGGSIGVLWLAREPTELDRFLELIEPAKLKFVRAVRLDTIRPARTASAEQQTYLLVLQPISTAAPEVAVDTETVLSLAAVGALSLYDGLADLLESVKEPAELEELIAGEPSGSARQRLARYLASQPELEECLIELGKTSLLRELENRGTRREDLRVIDVRGLAQRLLGQLGFAVPRPVRFSIRTALRDCGVADRRLELADSADAVTEAYLAGFNHIQDILKYAVYAWGYLECGNKWNVVFEQVVSSSMPSYPGPEKLSFGHLHVLFTKLPTTFAATGQAPEKGYFSDIARAVKKAKVNEKLTTLVYWRNGVGHKKDYVTSLTVAQLRQKCSAVLTETCAALAELDRAGCLPVTVRPEYERRDSYNRRLLRLLDPDGAAIEVSVGSETDLTEPLIYFASDNNGRRPIDPKFLRASDVEALSGVPGHDSGPRRS